MERRDALLSGLSKDTTRRILDNFAFRFRLGMVLLLAASTTSALAAPIVFLEDSAQLTGPEPLDFHPLDVEVYINDMVVVAAARDGSWNLHRFERENGAWRYAEQLFSTSPADEFDRPSLALRDGVIAFAQRNAVHVFQRPFGTSYEYSTTLTPPEGVAELGSDVELGSGLFVGAETGRYQAIRFFPRPRVVWTYGEHFDGPPALEDRPDFYGGDIATEYEAIALGAPLLASDGRPDGRVHVFSGRNADFTQEKILRAPAGQDARDFGRYIGMNDRMLVATSGDGVLHLYDGAAFSWAYQSSLRSPDTLSQGFGSPAVAGDLVAYAMNDDDRGAGTGSIAVYRREGSRLHQVAELYSSEFVSYGLFRVSMQGSTVVATGRNSILAFELPLDFSTPAIVQEDFENFDAAGWRSYLTGQWSVEFYDGSHVYRQNDRGGAAHSVALNTNWTDQSIEADVAQRTDPIAWHGLAVRYQDADNHYYLVMRRDSFTLRKKVNGQYTTLASIEGGVSETGRVRLEAIGSRIRVYLNGTRLLEAVDSSLSRGRAALFTYRTRTEFDNVVITPSPLIELFNGFSALEDTSMWTLPSGNWSNPSPGAIFQVATGGVSRAVAGVATDDQIIESKGQGRRLEGSAWLGVFARHTNDANYYYLKLSANELSLRKVVNSSITELASVPFVGGSDLTYNLRLEAVGTSLRAYVNDRFLLGATDTSHSAGRYGLITYNTPGVFYDMKVWQP